MTTDRRHRGTSAQLRSVLATAPDVILTVDRDGKILFINRTNPPLTVERVIGTSCYDYVPADQRGRVEQALERVFRDRVINDYEIQGPPGPTGRRGWVYVRAGPLIEDDRVVAATLCATDITERRELGERLQKIASLLPGVVYQFKLRPDGSSCLPYASERLFDVFRVRPEEVREDASKLFATHHPEDAAAVQASILESARSLRPWQQEFRLRFPDGVERWIYGSSLPEKQEDGSVLWHGFAMDVTERKRLDEQLRHAQKVESIGRLAGGVAHDFNNLLTSVLGFAELAKELLPPGSPAAPHLQRVIESGERGAALNEQLLAFARKKIVHPEAVDLNEVLRRLGPMIERVLGATIQFVLSTSPQPEVVKIDVGSLEQVVMNLVLNARDAMPRGGALRMETGRVALGEDEARGQAEMTPGAYVKLAVIDTGTGLTPAVRARLFEPFFTTKPAGRGTGLGLATSHGIVRQAGGHITAAGEPGRGSAFTVYLPAVDATAARPPRAAEELRRAGGSETLLVVEDDRMILDIAVQSLQALGYRVLAAPDGVRALEAAAAHAAPIDLLVTDVVMPRMGGRELAERLLALRPGLRVLFASGHTEDAIVDQGVLEAGLHFLQKPYLPSVLARRVRDILDATAGRLPGSGS